MSMILAILLLIFLLRLFKDFEDYPRRWKLVEGTLERDFQRLCLDLSRYGDLKQYYIANTLIKAEMFESLIENTKYLISNKRFMEKVRRK